MKKPTRRAERAWTIALLALAALGMTAWASATLDDGSTALMAWTAALGALLLAIAAEDLRSLTVPDPLSFPLIGLGLAFAFSWPVAAPETHVVGAAVGYGAFWALDRAYVALRGRTGLGDGDAVLFAAAGAWLGPEALPSVAVIAALAGLVGAVARGLVRAGSFEAPIAFAPSLALAHWAVWLHGPLVLL